MYVLLLPTLVKRGADQDTGCYLFLTLNKSGVKDPNVIWLNKCIDSCNLILNTIYAMAGMTIDCTESVCYFLLRKIWMEMMAKRLLCHSYIDEPGILIRHRLAPLCRWYRVWWLTWDCFIAKPYVWSGKQPSWTISLFTTFSIPVFSLTTKPFPTSGAIVCMLFTINKYATNHDSNTISVADCGHFAHC